MEAGRRAVPAHHDEVAPVPEPFFTRIIDALKASLQEGPDAALRDDLLPLGMVLHQSAPIEDAAVGEVDLLGFAGQPEPLQDLVGICPPDF